MSDLQISYHTDFIGIFPKYANDTKLPRVFKISVLQVLAECGKTAYEIIIDEQLYWKWIPSHVLFKDFPNNFSNILWFFVNWKETDFMELFLITSLKHVWQQWYLTSILNGYLLLWILQSSTVWCIVSPPFKVLQKI